MERKNRILLAAAALALAALPSLAQKDRNYYTQVVQLKDGTEVRLLPDDVSRINVLADGEWTKTTAYDYVTLGRGLQLDSVAAFLRRHGDVDGLAARLSNENSQVDLALPDNAAWGDARQALAPWFCYAPVTAYYYNDPQGQAYDATAVIDAALAHDAHSGRFLLEAVAQANLTPATRQQVLNGSVSIVDAVPASALRQTLVAGPQRVVCQRDGTLTEETAGTVAYVHVVPWGGYAKPVLDVSLPGVLSRTYELSCVLMPGETAGEGENGPRPNCLSFSLKYTDPSGKLCDLPFLNEREDDMNYMTETFGLKDNSSNYATIRSFRNDPTRIDTLVLGTFTFPAAYYGLEEALHEGVTPKLRVTSPFSTFNKSLMEAFTRDIRLAAIILRPVDATVNDN